MIENYKGWDISLTWEEKNCFLENPRLNKTYNKNEKWRGVNLYGKSIYGASLKEIRHIIDYPLLHK